MKAISFANQKGGVGKSTLCTSLACVAADALILDVDPQGTAGQWFQSRPEDREAPECAVAKPSDVAKAIKATPRRWVFIDTPGDLTAQEAIAASDFCIVPVRASIHDLRAAARTVELLRGREGAFVINAAPPVRGTAANQLVIEARRALSAFKLPVCPWVMHQRAAFVHAAVAGLGVTEWDDEKAADEIRRLWEWLSAR
jgi:chromosome partitioning protein